MKSLGIHYSRWPQAGTVDYVPLLAKAKHLGYDQLEIDAYRFVRLSPLGRKRLYFEARNHQIDISYCIHPMAEHDISSLEENVRKEGLAFLQTLVRTIGEMGGGSLNGPMYGAFPAPFSDKERRQQRLEYSIQCMRMLSQLAQQEDVMLAIRPVNRYEHFLIPTASSALAYIQSVNHPNCGIDLDTFHMNIEESDLTQAIIQAGLYLHCMHLRENNQKAMGEGCLDWDAIQRGLGEISYQGPLVHMPLYETEVEGNIGESRRIREYLFDKN